METYENGGSREMTEDEEDIITIHLGKVLTQEQYDKVVASVIEFMNQRWPNCQIGVDN